MSMLFGNCSLDAMLQPAKRKWADMFEVILLVGACFLVNYVTADAKTNWAEGWVLVSYYVMIVSPPPIISARG